MAEQMGVKMHHYLMTGHAGSDWLTCTSYGQAREQYVDPGKKKKKNSACADEDPLSCVSTQNSVYVLQYVITLICKSDSLILFFTKTGLPVKF
jgi:hypothetical protein